MARTEQLQPEAGNISRRQFNKEFLKGAIVGGLTVLLDVDRRNTNQQLAQVHVAAAEELAQQGIVPPTENDTQVELQRLQKEDSVLYGKETAENVQVIRRVGVPRKLQYEYDLKVSARAFEKAPLLAGRNTGDTVGEGAGGFILAKKIFDALRGKGYPLKAGHCYTTMVSDL